MDKISPAAYASSFVNAPANNIKIMLRTHFLKLLLLLLLSISNAYSETIKAPTATDGELDLSGWNFNQNGSVKLNGQWQFYWSKLLSPQDFLTPALSTESLSKNIETLKIPGAWNRKKIDGKKIGRIGFATLRLKVKLPPSSEPLAIRTKTIISAYKMWVNGELLSSRGEVGTTVQTNIPEMQHDVIVIPGRNQSLDIVMQISNFHRHKAGLIVPLKIGTQKQLERTFFQDQVIGSMIIGGLVFFGLYFLGRYFLGRVMLKRSERGVLWFSAASLLWAGHASFWGLSGDSFSRLLSVPHWQITYTAVYIIFFLAVPAVTTLICALFPKDSNALFYKISLALGALFSLSVITGNNFVYTHFIVYHEILALIQILYVTGVLVRAVRNKREGGWPLLLGFLVFATAAGNDILLSNGIIDSVYLTLFGLMVMIFTQAHTLSLNAARNQLDVELLSGELKEKNRALERSDQSKDEFLANTSHELRTPLNGIIGLAESLQHAAGQQSREQRQHDLSLIATSGRRLANLVNDILDLSRLKSRELQLQMVSVDLHALTATVLTLCAPLAEKKELQLHNAVAADLPLVLADEDRLQQILYNLIGNAIKFTDHGEVAISATHNDAEVTLVVRDTGIGIPEIDQQAIFRPYEQVDSSASRSGGGIGLGLGISRQLVALHGGTLVLESSLGQGSSFRFTLPFYQGEPLNRPSVGGVSERLHHILPAETAPMATTATSQMGKRILVVDDDPVNLQVALNHLNGDGLSVTTAMGGEEALALIEGGENFDLVLLDIMMPGITGFEVCRRLRHRYSAVQLPVIMVTAKNRLSDLVEGLACGANDYLTKPFVREELLARTRAQLNVHAAHLALKENRLLKSELEQRQQTEAELRQTQTRLTGVVDGLERALLVVNQSEEIVLCNRQFEKWLGYPTEKLLGHPLKQLFEQETIEQLRQTMAGLINAQNRPEQGTAPDPESLIASAPINSADHRVERATLQPSLLEIEEEQLLLLFLYPEAQCQGETVETVELADPRPLLDALAPTQAKDEANRERHQLVVEVMNRAQDLWAQETATTKVELARSSGLWRVYVDSDGWERTQTLDRYLHLNNLPKHPRWRQVVRTAEFVLEQCPGDGESHARLRHAIELLEQAG